MATHSSVLAWRILGTEESDGYPRGCKESDMTEHRVDMGLSGGILQVRPNKMDIS